MVTLVQTMDTSFKGRTYKRGQPLSEDLKQLILDELISSGADKNTGVIPKGVKSAVADRYKVDKNCVTRVWSNVLHHGTASRPHESNAGRPQKLDEEQVRYVEMIKREKPSATMLEIKEKLEENANISVSKSTVNRTVRNRLSGKPWSRKRLQKSAYERFTYDNLRYTENFLQVIAAADPVRLRFFDESGFNSRDCTSRYGHSEKGTPCVEVQRYSKTSNLTLNMLIGMDGVKYANILNGASDTDSFLQFFAEAAEADSDYGPALAAGDIVVVDNAPIHHHRARHILTLFLQNIGIQLIYTPRYSPDFNPAEFSFCYLKTLLRGPHYRELVHENLEAAIYRAILTISAADTRSFFRQTGLFNF